jgi:aspartyl-tRNA(Asn)/glutamyl-tRNA(Gln) amidotransferase subunit A
MPLYEKSAVELSAMLKKKECSAMELTESVLGRIAQADQTIGAYLTVCAGQALAQAAEVDARRRAGEELSPLAGIPVGLKDNICTRGVATTCASRMLENFVPPYDATVVEKLKSAGAVITGKLNMDEFAMGSSCESSHMQITRNPHDITRVPGGSSGGSAAAVAAGEAVVALGTDTGGSIRQPAGYCGIVGLKPTYGAVSRYGVVAFASSLDQVGPMARTVPDAALLYSVIRGQDPRDATSARREHPDLTRLGGGGVKGLRIGIPEEYFGDGVAAEVRDRVLEAIGMLKSEGAEIREISLPSTDAALSAYYIISSAEASSNLARFDGVKYGHRAKEYDDLTDLYERSRSEGFGDEVKRRILLGTFVLSSGFYDAYYKRAKVLQQRIADEFAGAFAHCDLLATPTTPFAAFRLGENVDDPIKMYAADICTATANIAGLPAISIPCKGGAGSLPVGLQLIGPRFSERRLLEAAHHYESLVGGFGPIPAISGKEEQR